jgi:signal transduction histidine kinase
MLSWLPQGFVMALWSARTYRRQTIRFRLGCLVAACLLPICLVASVLVVRGYEYKRSLIEQQMVQTARALSMAVDRDLGNIQSALQVLATSPYLATDNFAGFHTQAQAVVRVFSGADIILADATTQQFVNTYRRFGEPLPKRNAAAAVQHIFETGKPIIGDLFLGAVTNRPLIGVDVPVLDGDKVIYDLAMTLPADRLTAILFQQHLPPNWLGTILDSKQVIAARTVHAGELTGRQVGSDLRKRMAESADGALIFTNSEGVKVLAAFSQSATSGWSVVISMPEAKLRTEIWQWLWWSVGGILLVLLASLGLVTVMAGSIAQSIRSLMAPALALGRGEVVHHADLDLQETNAVGEALAAASDLLSRRAEERDLAERALTDRTRLLQHQYESLRALNDIGALSQVDGARQLTEALALGLHNLGLSIGIISHVEGSRYTVQHHSAPPDVELRDGQIFDLGSTYCSMTLAANDVVAISHMGKSENAGHPCYTTFGLESYIGAPIMVNGRRYGTVNFSAAEPYPRDFDEGDREFMHLLARWMGGVLERQLVHQELARSNAELEQFAYVASHDLREPLRQVSSYVTLLERRYAAVLDDDARAFIGFARDGAKRMDSLILDLLDYSRIGRHERPMVPVELAAVLAEAVGNMGVAIEDAGARVDLPSELPLLRGDYVELVRLFQNLISNAVKYRDAKRPLVVTVSVQCDGLYWLITLADNGIGIAPEHFERIFRIFQRLHGHGEYEGTGIGLASCKKIAEHHGGRIWLDSTPDQGSAFTVALPAVLSVDSIGQGVAVLI